MLLPILLSVLAFSGLIGNTVIIAKFFLMQENKLNFHRIMILLSLYDNALIVMYLILFVAPAFSDAYKFGVFNYIAPVALPVGEIAITGSIYSTIAITLDRFLVVCCPFYAISHRWSVKRYIIPIVMFSLLYNVPIFLEIKSTTINCAKIYDNTSVSTITNQEGVEGMYENVTVSICNKEFSKRRMFKPDCGLVEDCIFQKLAPTTIRQNYIYFTIYHIIFDLFFKCIAPFVILIVLNTLMIKRFIHKKDINDKNLDNNTVMNNKMNMSLITRRSEDSHSFVYKTDQTTSYRKIFLAKVNLIIVFFCILCHSIRWIPQFYEIFYGLEDWPQWITTVKHISHIAILLTSSINCCIYYNLPFRLVSQTRQCHVNNIT